MSDTQHDRLEQLADDLTRAGFTGDPAEARRQIDQALATEPRGFITDDDVLEGAGFSVSRWRRNCCPSWSDRDHTQLCENYGGR